MVDYEKVWHIFITSWIKSDFDRQILSVLGLNQHVGKRLDIIKFMQSKYVKKQKSAFEAARTAGYFG